MSQHKLIIILAFITIITLAVPPNPCNATANYTFVANGTCYIQCPWVPPTQYYSDPNSNTCLATCPAPYFGFQGNKSCVSICPTSPNITYYDHINRKCVTQCPSNYSASSNQSCLNSCPSPTFSDQTLRICVTTCPTGTYYYTGIIPICVTVCPSNYYAYPVNRICYAGGSCPSTPVVYYSDDTTNLCVSACPLGYFADNSTKRCLIYCSATYYADGLSGKCVTTCPSGYFRSDVTRTCLKNCTIGYFADSISKNCTQHCSAGTFGDATTGSCNPVCTQPYFADSTVSLCVTICSSGLFANNFTQSCVTAANCYSNTIGDPTTNKCINSINCPKNPYMFADLTNKICTTRCTTWGDTTLQQCVATCPWNSATYVTYKNPDTRQCVTKCPIYPVRFADNQTRTCQQICSQTPTAPFNTYADATTLTCVTDCPTGYQADTNKKTCIAVCTTKPVLQFYNPLDGTCVTACPTGTYADNFTLTCSTVCSINPKYYSYDINNTCLFSCPNGYYADNSTQRCVEQCPQTTLEYADDSTNQCVSVCPLTPDYFGQLGIDGYRTCVSTCLLGTFADPISRTCVSACNISLGYYGQLLTPVRRCITQCPLGQFADNITAMCISKCPSYPKIYFGYQNDKTCVIKCPNGLYGNSVNNLCVIPVNCPANYFADDSTNLCVSVCPASANTFGESITRKCLQTCPQGKYANPVNRLCGSGCNATFYKDISTKSCVKICPSTPNLYADPNNSSCMKYCTNNYFAHDLTRTCVPICPSTPPYYGNLVTRRCVAGCPAQTFIFTNNTFRGCVAACPPRVYSSAYSVDLYADNSTGICVTLCPKSQNLYNFKHPINSTVRICVSTCPMVGSVYYFAENITQSCVTTCPSDTQLTYGDKFTSKCVKICSRDQYRDNTTSQCRYYCSPGYYADNTTWNCVDQCPTGYFAETTNNTCVKHCPTNFYADNLTKYCISLCNSSTLLYSDNTTWTCTNRCTEIPDFYADLTTKRCSLQCSATLYADDFTRSCLPAINCSNQTIGDPTTGKCITVCPIQIPSFLDNDTNLCKTTCPAGSYADNSTMTCVLQCPSDPDFYAYNHSTLLGLCVLFCPIVPTPYYRYSQTRECVISCPAPNYFKDTNNMQCVTQCPPFYFAEPIGQICISNCSLNNKYGLNNKCYSICPNNTNADPTTFLCVQTCPFGYYAQNSTCVVNCTLGNYSDAFTKICSPVCSPDYYSYLPTFTCVQDCQPQYKYFPNQTCIASCPTSANLSVNLYMDDNSFSCVNICLYDWFADNLTRSCTQTCSSILFADNSTGLCVTKCPQSPDYYGYNLKCYFPCPTTSPLVYAQNLTRTCMQICPNGSFADSFNKRCVLNCTGTQYGFSDSTVNICVDICPSPTFGNNQTKTCVNLCPNNTFGQNTTRLCLLKCPTGTYADIHLNLCVEYCNATIPEFADNSTHTCVTECPSIPSLYGQFFNGLPICVFSCSNTSFFTLNTTRLCVQHCPYPFFADPVTGDCAYFCPFNHNLYADNDSRTCATSCPNITVGNATITTYADDSTKTCVFICPVNPSLYGQNSTNRCVDRCPNASFGDKQSRLCLQTCFFGIYINNFTKFTFADSSTNFCVYHCPSNSWADNYTITCTNQCTNGSSADDSTWTCVKMCPANPISFAYLPTKKCIYACPVNYYASDVGRVCMFKACPIIPYFYYKDTINNQCVLKCVYPYFGEITSQSCVTNCSYGFFQDLGNMACTRCPTTCLTCINSGNCTTCQKNLYLHQGQCITDCPTFPIYYFKYDPAFSCIESCPSPYFGFFGTGKCQKSCPSTYFSNLTSIACQPCTLGCNSCYGLNCSSCITGYILVLKYATCSKKCSLSNQYYLNNQCVSSCQVGTFMLDDLVTCQKCNPVCSECSQIATNCTKCQGTFWYNYNCVTQCPSNYYVANSNFCKQCSDNPSACTEPPLTYTLTTYTKNYKLYANVTFNRAVNLTQSEFVKIARLSTQKGPIKASEYSLSQITQTTYRLTFMNSASLNELSLYLSFTPGSISDMSGTGLTTMTSSTSISVSTTISTAMITQADSLQKQVKVIGWILIIVLMLMMIKCTYPLVVLIDLIQYIHMHVYVLVLPLPYLFMKVLSSLNHVQFMFLPALYKIKDPNVDDPYNFFQDDTTFLGNCQPFVFFLAIFGGTYLLTWLLSNKTINRCSWLRKKAKRVFKNRMRFSFIHQIFYYTQLYVLFFAFYQFTGANSNLPESSTNLAAAIIVFLCYAVWFITITYIAVSNRGRLTNMPQKYKFLVYEDSQFPMQIPFRAFTKIIFACILIAPEVSVQLILLIIFNIIYIIYTLCYTPSTSKITNYINTTIHLFMIIYEIVLFIYDTSDKNTTYQATISLVLLSLMGVAIVIVVGWMLYRLVTFIRVEYFGWKPPVVEEEVKSSKMDSKVDYQKVKISTKRSKLELDGIEKDKEMNISQLNFNDEQEQVSDGPSINADEAIQQFTYHHVPKKTEAMIKQENALLGIKQDKKKNGPMVIQIDEDELIDVKNSRPSQSRSSNRLKKDTRIKSGRRGGHLRIDAEDSQIDLQEIKMTDMKKEDNKQQSEQSNYFSRRKRNIKKQQVKPSTQQNVVVWDNIQHNQLDSQDE